MWDQWPTFVRLIFPDYDDFSLDYPGGIAGVYTTGTYRHEKKTGSFIFEAFTKIASVYSPALLIWRTSLLLQYTIFIPVSFFQLSSSLRIFIQFILKLEFFIGQPGAT